jgi:hypothetical protein
MSYRTCDHLKQDGAHRESSAALVGRKFCYFRRSKRKMALQLLAAQDFAYNLFVVNYLRIIPAISLKMRNLGDGGEGVPRQTVCVAFARQSSQKPLSLISMYSTACEGAMTQRKSSQ